MRIKNNDGMIFTVKEGKQVMDVLFAIYNETTPKKLGSDQKT